MLLIRFGMIIVLFSLTLSYALADALSQLSSDEQKIIYTIRQHLPQTIIQLERSVNINSGSMNLSGVKLVGNQLTEHFDALGFTTQWIDGNDFKRAGHLIATWQSPHKTATKILMIGHLDTVFTKDDPFQQYKKLNNEQAAGPGIIDMKGGNLILLSALATLKKLQLLDSLSIRVVLTGDEENSGRPLSLSKKAVVEGGKWADIALGFENGDSDIGTAMVARRGYSSWTLDVVGKPAHSSQIFRRDIGVGAVFEAARILNAFRMELAEQTNLTFNPGLVLGGTKIDHQTNLSKGTAFGKANVIAQTVRITGDIRALSAAQLIAAKQTMQAIVSDNLAHTAGTLNFTSGYPPMSPSPGNYKLLAMYNQVSQDLGYNVVVEADPRKAGAADISFAAEHVDMAIDGLGLMGSGAHTKNEVADLTSLPKNIEKAAILLFRLGQQTRTLP